MKHLYMEEIEDFLRSVVDMDDIEEIAGGEFSRLGDSDYYRLTSTARHVIDRLSYRVDDIYSYVHRCEFTDAEVKELKSFEDLRERSRNEFLDLMTEEMEDRISEIYNLVISRLLAVASGILEDYLLEGEDEDEGEY